MATIPFPWKTVVQDVTTWSERWGNYGNTSRMLAIHSMKHFSSADIAEQKLSKILEEMHQVLRVETMMVLPNKGVFYSIRSLDALSLDYLSEAEIN